MKTPYRYPGVKPFEAADAPLFFGRERDQAYLLELVKRESLTIMFGRSGYGKSSLVKAGLIPALEADPGKTVDPEGGEEITIPNLPVYIRFNLYSPHAQSGMPRDTLITRFLDHAGPDDTDATLRQFFQQKGIEQTLWSEFKCNKAATTQHIYLVFDQFEEFFTYPLEAQAQFRRELSELLYTRIPQRVRDVMDDLDRHGKHLLHRPLRISVLFVIRSDRMHLLNSMKDDLPSILKTRYELKALDAQQAEDAIVKPAQLSGESFWLIKPFVYEPEALHKILYELSKPAGTHFDPDEQRSIEAFQLQMVCQTIEQSLINRTDHPDNQPGVVKLSDLPDFEQIYEQYYTDKLGGLPDPESRNTAQVMLEEVLIIGEAVSEARRVSMDKDVLRETMQRDHKLALPQELLDYLEDKFLIRRENIGGQIHYEISHDVLLAPMVRSRDEERQRNAKALEEAEARIRQLKAEQRIRAAEILAAREQEKRREAERRRRHARWLAAASVVGFILAAATGAWAFTQKARAEHALKLVNQEKEKNLKQEFRQTLNSIEAILKTPNGCPDSFQLIELDTVPPHFPKDSALQHKVEHLKKRIVEQNCR